MSNPPEVAHIANLEAWLKKESQYVRLRAAATGETLEKTFERVGAVLEEEAQERFPGVDALVLLVRRVARERDLADLSYEMIQEMRLVLKNSSLKPGGDPPPVPPNAPPPRTPSPAAAMQKLVEEMAEMVKTYPGERRGR